MNKKVHNQIVSFIWGIADDVLRDVFVRKVQRYYFTFCSYSVKSSVLCHINDMSALKAITKYLFWNTSKFTFESLLNDADNIDSNPENIAYGSTLSKDGFPYLNFDYTLSNPPYGKTWKIDEEAIVDDKGKKGKEKIKDSLFEVGSPTISDGQLKY